VLYSTKWSILAPYDSHFRQKFLAIEDAIWAQIAGQVEAGGYLEVD